VASSNIDIIADWFDHYNEVEFGNKLTVPHFGISRNSTEDGSYEYRASRGWRLMRCPSASKLWIGEHCFEDDDHFHGTLLHEMIHAYQIEIMDRKPNHDAIFCSIARKLERKYSLEVK
jgi:hypothetical protein